MVAVAAVAVAAAAVRLMHLVLQAGYSTLVLCSRTQVFPTVQPVTIINDNGISILHHCAPPKHDRL